MRLKWPDIMPAGEQSLAASRVFHRTCHDAHAPIKLHRLACHEYERRLGMRRSRSFRLHLINDEVADMTSMMRDMPIELP